MQLRLYLLLLTSCSHLTGLFVRLVPTHWHVPTSNSSMPLSVLSQCTPACCRRLACFRAGVTFSTCHASQHAASPDLCCAACLLLALRVLLVAACCCLLSTACQFAACCWRAGVCGLLFAGLFTSTNKLIYYLFIGLCILIDRMAKS